MFTPPLRILARLVSRLLRRCRSRYLNILSRYFGTGTGYDLRIPVISRIILYQSDQGSEDIKNAKKAKDKVALETLRNVKKFFLEAKTAPGANDTLTDADALKIMQKLVKQGKDSATIYVQQGRQDLADVELEQVKVIENLGEIG